MSLPPSLVSRGEEPNRTCASSLLRARLRPGQRCNPKVFRRDPALRRTRHADEWGLLCLLAPRILNRRRPCFCFARGRNVHPGSHSSAVTLFLLSILVPAAAHAGIEAGEPQLGVQKAIAGAHRTAGAARRGRRQLQLRRHRVRHGVGRSQLRRSWRRVPRRRRRRRVGLRHRRRGHGLDAGLERWSLQLSLRAARARRPRVRSGRSTTATRSTRATRTCGPRATSRAAST